MPEYDQDLEAVFPLKVGKQYEYYFQNRIFSITGASSIMLPCSVYLWKNNRGELFGTCLFFTQAMSILNMNPDRH